MTATKTEKQGIQKTEKRYVALIKMPMDAPRLRDSPPCVESHLSYSTIKRDEISILFCCVVIHAANWCSFIDGMSCEGLLLQNVSAELPQVVFLKVAPLAEEASIGRGFFVVLVLQGGEFNAASEVCNLKHPKFSWMCLSVHHRTLEEGVLERCVKDASYEGLPVVVVDFDEVEVGELVETVKQELGQITPHGACELVR